jgi:hypothetical protein
MRAKRNFREIVYSRCLWCILLLLLESSHYVHSKMHTLQLLFIIDLKGSEKSRHPIVYNDRKKLTRHFLMRTLSGHLPVLRFYFCIYLLLLPNDNDSCYFLQHSCGLKRNEVIYVSLIFAQSRALQKMRKKAHLQLVPCDGKM